MPFYVHIPRFYPSVYFCPLIISRPPLHLASRPSLQAFVFLFGQPHERTVLRCLHSFYGNRGMEILHTFICLTDTVLPGFRGILDIRHPPSTVAYQLESRTSFAFPVALKTYIVRFALNPVRPCQLVSRGCKIPGVPPSFLISM